MSFSQEKRNYLHNKLDEVLRLWFRNAGQGYFNLVVNNGVPEFQFGVYSDMGDGLQPDQEHSSPPQHVRVQTSKTPSADARYRHYRAVLHAVVLHTRRETEDEQLHTRQQP